MTEVERHLLVGDVNFLADRMQMAGEVAAMANERYCHTL